jgi:GxxExxY protein
MIHHGDTEARTKLLHEALTEQIIGAAIEVHRALGPGLLESAYEECLCHEFHSPRNLIRATKAVGG